VFRVDSQLGHEELAIASKMEPKRNVTAMLLSPQPQTHYNST
jgi:hypothetical protein